jgi:hypothetical protein
MTTFPRKSLCTTAASIIIPFLLAIIAILVGIIGQEEHWFSATNGPKAKLEQAEQDFRNGNNRAAIALFTRLAKKDDPVAQYWLAHMTELGLGVPRDPAKAVELYKTRPTTISFQRSFGSGRSTCTAISYRPISARRSTISKQQPITASPVPRCCWVRCIASV